MFRAALKSTKSCDTVCQVTSPSVAMLQTSQVVLPSDDIICIEDLAQFPQLRLLSGIHGALISQ